MTTATSPGTLTPYHRRKVDEPGFLGPRNDPWADPRLLRDRLQELAAVFGLAGGAGRHRDHLVDLVGYRPNA